MSLSIHSRAICAAAILIIGIPAIARAQSAPPPSPAPLTEIGHVQTSDRSIETITSAARTTYVITKEQLVRYGYRTVGDAIASIPGVEVSHYGATGSSVQFGVRGSSSAQVLVLVDGIPAPGSLAGSVNLGVFPTSGVQRIEVVEGGGSTLYGTGSIGGIVNIITQGKTPRSTADVRIGSFGDQAFRFESNGFAYERVVAKNAYVLPDGTTRADSDYLATSVHAGVDGKIGSFNAELRAGITDDHVGADGPVSFSSPSSRENDLNGFASIILSHHATQSLVTFELGGSVQRIGFGCDPVNDSNCFQPSVSTSREGAASFNFRNEVSARSSRLLYGIDLARGVVRSDSGGTAIPPTPNVSTNALAQTAVYAQQTWFFGAGARFYAGLRGERDGSLGGEFSPALGISVPLSSALWLKANAASAFRAPNASELYFPGYGNPALHAERANVADLSIVDSHLLGGTTLGWFTNRTNNLIIPVLIDPVLFTFAPENVDHALIDGLTFETRTKPMHGVSAVFTITDLYRADDLDAQSRLPHDPVISTTFGLVYSGNPQASIESAGVTIHSAGARGFVDFTQPSFTQPVPYTTVDGFIRWNLSRTLRLSLRGGNLGNERFSEVSGFPMPGRSFALELSSH